MGYDFKKMLDTTEVADARDFSFNVKDTGLMHGQHIVDLICKNLAKNIAPNSFLIDNDLVRSILRVGMLLEQALLNLEEVEQSINSGVDPLVRSLFVKALTGASRDLAGEIMNKASSESSIAATDELDCEHCDATSCLAHPSRAAGAAEVEEDDEGVQFISEKEDAETATARHLDLSEMPPELQEFIKSLSAKGDVQIRAFRVNMDPSH